MLYQVPYKLYASLTSRINKTLPILLFSQKGQQVKVLRTPLGLNNSSAFSSEDVISTSSTKFIVSTSRINYNKGGIF